MRGDVEYLPDIMIKLRELEFDGHKVKLELNTDYGIRLEQTTYGFTMCFYDGFKQMHESLHNTQHFGWLLRRIEGQIAAHGATGVQHNEFQSR